MVRVVAGLDRERLAVAHADGLLHRLVDLGPLGQFDRPLGGVGCVAEDTTIGGEDREEVDVARDVTEPRPVRARRKVGRALHLNAVDLAAVGERRLVQDAPANVGDFVHVLSVQLVEFWIEVDLDAALLAVDPDRPAIVPIGLGPWRSRPTPRSASRAATRGRCGDRSWRHRPAMLFSFG